MSPSPPPAASTTDRATSVPAAGPASAPVPSYATRQPSALAVTPVTSRAGASTAPARRARASSTSRTEDAWRESG